MASSDDNENGRFPRVGFLLYYDGDDRSVGPAPSVDYGKYQIREISVECGPKFADALLSKSRPGGLLDALEEIKKPATSTPVPGRQNVAGTTEHYLFHYNDQFELVYRTIATRHDEPRAITRVTGDRSVTVQWGSWKGITKPIAIMPVPGRQGIDGKSESYVFHLDPKTGKLTYRTISVAHDAAHADALVVPDRVVADWWKSSLSGVDQLAMIMRVPGPPDGNAECFWVFHRDPKGTLLYRKIKVDRDTAHADTLVTEDRVVADWWTSLKGVS
ncbi:hypothetical protein [Kitasatospora kifunensis]|uniref:Uncharacterized protein n=1 Tax=Kitasatospora kifunensis TaxID=58351 RepID=A0A7W7W088_KITKI|nr:hypothetical protein [Kitasatospora kifunensis]MBB4928425.1 hypothetical protein [Kitasatospora kifunensis]